MGLKANMSRIVGQNVEELDLPICRGILANMSTNFWLVRADSYFPPEERVRLVRLVSNWVLPGERSGELSVEYSWNKL